MFFSFNRHMINVFIITCQEYHFSINERLKFLWDKHYHKGGLHCQMLKTHTFANLQCQ